MSGPASEHEIVKAFLQAEFDSVRFGHAYRLALSQRGVGRSIIDKAEITDEAANRIRADVLGEVRGYGVGRDLFYGFPKDITWSRVQFQASEIGSLRYGRFDEWVILTSGTRLVSDGVRGLDSPLCKVDTRAAVKAIAKALMAGVHCPPIIIVGPDIETGDFVILEGHARATAYALTGLPNTVEAFVGCSPRISEWAWA